MDGALLALLRQGVYVTLDEFKGRRPIVRGATSFVADPTQFRNPLSGSHVAFPSGGSRGKATPDPLRLLVHPGPQAAEYPASSSAVWTSSDGRGRAGTSPEAAS